VDSRTRKLASRLLLVPLVLAVLTSLAGVGALVLERRGLVILRRVPHPILKSWVEPGEVTQWLAQGTTIAIVNTDTTPGSFLLRFVDRRAFSESWDRIPMGFVEAAHPISRHVDAVRVWVPARSVVLRTRERQRVTLLLDAPDHALGFFDRDHAERAFPRGKRATLDWQLYASSMQGVTPTRFWVAGDRPLGFRVVERPGVAEYRKDDSSYYHWDGEPVEVDIDAGSSPMLTRVLATAYSDTHPFGESHAWAYDPDMTIIDEREPRK
jgi:hypothetical protein